MHNVTSRRVRGTFVAVERPKVLLNLSVCICSLRCPICNVYGPFCHVVFPALQHFSKLSHKR